MTRKGPHRTRLESYVLDADPKHIDHLNRGLVGYIASLQQASTLLNRALALVQQNMEGETAQAAKPHLHHSSLSMRESARTVGPATQALGAASTTYSTAKAIVEGMKDIPDDPQPADQSTPEGIAQQAANQKTINQNQAAYEAQEQQAAALTAQLDADNQAAVEELKKIHGIPDPPPAPAGSGSPQGPGGGSNPYTGPRGGGVPDSTIGPGATMVGDPYPIRNPIVPTPVLVHPEVRDPQVVVDPYGPPDDGPDDGKDPGRTPDGGGGGYDGTDGNGGDGSFEGVTADGSGTSGHSFLGGGLSGAATAGIIGGAGVGIGALGLAGRAVAGRGIPGLTGSGRIGATARTAGSAVTGRAGAAGTRAGAGAGRGAGRAGAAGAKGAKGAAGGRGGAGAGAGGRGRGKKGREKGSVWDGVEDGDQWLDDDNATGAVLD